MDFKHSDVLVPSTYKDDGLANGVPLRIHRDPYKEAAGALRAQRDWNSAVSPVRDYQGGLGHPFSFIRVTIPECIPERLEIISYANEYAFLYDDEMEHLDLKNFQEGRDDMLHVFSNDTLNEGSPVEARPEKKLQAQILAEMMVIDKKQAITTMKAWAKFVDLASRTRSEPFETLDTYLPSRTIDAGELFWFGMLTFAMALTIPPAELDLCMKFARPGYAAISLTNDLYSWRKEREDAEKAGQDYVFNAVWVIMRERNCTEEAALRICKQEIKRHFTEFEVILKSREARALSHDTRVYLQAVRLSHVGNLVWSIYCPRYHHIVEPVAPLVHVSMASRLLDAVLRITLAPLNHFMWASRHLFRLRSLPRLMSRH